jgi:DNA ligase-associated metallophosphoesterase
MKHKYNLKDYKFNHLGQNLLLHPYKALFWKEKKILFLSDLHIGKAMHFRKSGIPVPEEVHKADFERLKFLFELYNPSRLIFLGDVFHSIYNAAWEEFRYLFTEIIKVRPELVVGNHDILDPEHYAFMDVHTHTLQIGPFILSHEPLDEDPAFDLYNLCGHLHPSVLISGHSKQSFRVECFYFSEKRGILPAFGNFTGTSKLSGKMNGNKIFAVTDEKIIPLF